MKIKLLVSFLLILVFVAVIYAQTRVPSVSGIPRVVSIIADELVYMIQYKIAEINWDKQYVESLPAGSSINLDDGSSMVREDWIAAADATIADLQSRINRINSAR